jgi:cell division inhibitor SepF
MRDTEPTTVRPIARGGAASASAAVTYPTHDNLALAPERDAQRQIEPETVPAQRTAPPVTADDRRYQITTLHPTTYNEARAIGEHFRDGVPVIMNLTDMAEPDAKRLVDFAAGLAFGLRGTMERVTNRVFLLSPANIQVTAEDKAKIAEGGFFRS